MRVHQASSIIQRRTAADVEDWSWNTTRRRLGVLWRLTKPYRFRTFLSCFSLLAATATALAPPFLAKYALDDAIHDKTGFRLTLVVALFIFVALANWGMTYVETYMTGWVGERILADLRAQLFGHLQALSLGFYERNRAGVLISRMTNDVEAIDQLVTDGVTTLAQSTLMLSGTAFLLIVLDPRLALATLIVIPFMIVASVFFRSRSARAYSSVRERLGLVTATLAEDISGMRMVQAFVREQRATENFRAVTRDYRDSNMQTVVLNALYFPFVALLATLALAIVLGYGGDLYLNDEIALTTLFAFMLYVNNFFDPIQQLSQLYNTFLSAAAAMDKIIGVLDEEPDVVDHPAAEPLGHIEGRVRFEDVHFAYGRGAEVLHGIDLDVPAGTTVALVGHTGAGKSTIAKLIARFYEPTSGRLTIDGVDLNDVSQESLRRQLGIVPQEGFLFAGTVAENIAFGKPDAKPEEIVRAAQTVGAHEVTALARPAPARRVRTGAARRPPDPDPRRGHVLGRHRNRTDDRARAANAAFRPHVLRDRAPSIDDPRRRPDRGARARAGDRARLARRAPRPPGSLHEPLRRLGRRLTQLTAPGSTAPARRRRSPPCRASTASPCPRASRSSRGRARWSRRCSRASG
jgi:ABC-type multidrug transport system fused ATPase/permease subunit